VCLGLSSIGSAALSGAFGGLLAYAILHMNGVAGKAGWRWYIHISGVDLTETKYSIRLYIIEGLITIVFAIVCYFLIPDSLETAYFLTEDDKDIMRKRAEASKAYSNDNGHPSRVDIRLALTDPKVYVSGLCQLGSVTILYGKPRNPFLTMSQFTHSPGFGTFLPIIIKNGLHFSTVQAQYLTIPVYVWGTIIYFLAAMWSDRFSNRFLPLIIFAPLTAIGYAIILSPVSAGVQYFATFLVATGCYICAGINFSWLAVNSAPDGKRAASVGIQQTLAQLAGIVSGQIYQTKSAPKYTLGHAWSLGSICIAWLGWWVFRAMLVKREQKKTSMRGDELINEGLWDDKAPDFEYQL
jgi:MFS family permease